MLEKEFVPYQQALELKELGFDEPCFGFYGGLSPLGDRYYYDSTGYNRNSDIEDSDGLHCTRALYQQAFRWFREKHNLYHEIIRAGKDGEFNAFVGDYIYGNNGKYSPSIFTYEEAELACLRKLIEIIKNEKT